jgi:hypothetical protein
MGSGAAYCAQCPTLVFTSACRLQVTVLASVLGMSLAGAIAPVVRILGVDPLVVFKR